MHGNIIIDAPEVWYDAIILIRKILTRDEFNIIIEAS